MKFCSQRLLLRLYALPLRPMAYLLGLVLLIPISWLVTADMGVLAGGWLGNIFAFVCILRSPPQHSRMLLAGYILGQFILSGVLGEPGTAVSSSLEVLIASWLVRKHRPLPDEYITPNLLVQLIGNYILVAIPGGLLAGGLMTWEYPHPDWFPLFWRGGFITR